MPAGPITKNSLFYGDNLRVLREHIPDASIDLIYLDPPFDADAVTGAHSTETDNNTPITTFDDVWHWNADVEATYNALLRDAPSHVGTLVAILRNAVGGNTTMAAFLVMMTARLIELHRVLKPTGSLYLHSDPLAMPYLKVIVDAIFGAEHYRNTITWQRTTARSDARHNYGQSSDAILFYTKTRHATFNPQYTPYDEVYSTRNFRYSDADGRRYSSSDLRSPQPRPNLVYDYKGYHPHPNGWAVSLERMQELDRDNRLIFPKSNNGRIRVKRYLDELSGRPLGNIWDDIAPVSAQSGEHLGYPTQKPMALLERIIATSSDAGGWVLDPFCGCGTAVTVAQEPERRWIGIDVTYLAILLQRTRLQQAFPDARFDIVGEPESIDAARALADRDSVQFAWWALSLVDARPATGDPCGRPYGAITFIDEAHTRSKQVLVRVIAASADAAAMADAVIEVRDALERGSAVLALLISLTPPTAAMKITAREAGFYHSSGWNQKYPRVQLLTIEALLDGARPKMPPAWGTFRQAERVLEPAATQGTLDL